MEIAPLLTAREAAALLSISDRTLYRLLAEKRIPGAIRPGGSVRIRRDVLEQWIDQNTEQGRDERLPDGIRRIGA